MNRAKGVGCAVVLVGWVLVRGASAADVFNMPSGLRSLETVTVGNPGNIGEHTGEGAGCYGPDAIVGAVNYTYNVGKYEVTAAQYVEFLNAVAATDTYGLYNVYMAYPANTGGCGIERSGSWGGYTYSVGDGTPTDLAAWGNRPVTWVSFWDACRFANWLNNGQPIGPQDASTTEDGSYTLNGCPDYSCEMIQRNAGVRWVVPSEDEWYKAAYHKNDGATGNYFEHPCSSDTMPVAEAPPGGTNSANFAWAVEHSADVGAYTGSASPYGTFDQGGNVFEWNETMIYKPGEGWKRGLRSGSFSNGDSELYACYRTYGYNPWQEGNDIGFRVSEVTYGNIVLSRHLFTRTVHQCSMPVPDTLTIRSNGEDTLDYTITDDADWLWVTPESGNSGGEEDTITIHYAKVELPLGVHTARIVVHDSSAISDPRTITVTFTVTLMASDFNEDGDVDGFDFLLFSTCYNGSNKPPLEVCVDPEADLDSDGDVDGFDFLTFSNCFNGSNLPPRCP